jgi:hypothetical protein
VVVLPHVDKVFGLASGIQELILVEEPELEVLGHLLGIRGYGGTGARWREITINPCRILFICLWSILAPSYPRTPVPPNMIRNLPFPGLEVAIGILGVIDGRHEIGPVVAPFEESGVGCEE